MDELETVLEQLINLIKNGISADLIKKKMKLEMIDELIDIAKARIKNNKISEKLFYTTSDLRFATPEIVADYRAKRLKCNAIADLGCSVGLQSFAFAKKCKKVYAIELDEKKIAYAKKNADILGIKNIEFIHGDILDKKIIEKLDVDVVFCDPERLPAETERTIETIQPNIKKLMELYSKITKNICIELPPQIKSIPFDCEKEYLSVDGALNRLDVYLGSLKTSEISVVTLPTENIITDRMPSCDVNKSGAKKFLYEVDAAITKAGLLKQLLCSLKAPEVFYEGKFTLLTSDKKEKSPFIRNSYEYINSCIDDHLTIIKMLRKYDAGSIQLRGKIDEKQYWRLKNKIENSITGKNEFVLFFLENVVLCKKLRDDRKIN